MREPRSQEEPPDRQHGADVLGVGDPREWKVAVPRNLVAEAVPEEDTDGAEPVEDAQVQDLSGHDQGSRQCERGRTRALKPKEATWMDAEPGEEDRALKNLEHDEQRRNYRDQRSHPSNGGLRTHLSERPRMSRDPRIAQLLRGEQQRRDQKWPGVHLDPAPIRVASSSTRRSAGSGVSRRSSQSRDP